ncbi:glycosyltransferase family protein [Desulfovibrio legallii]|uniref:Glycosyl transferases group 1 n=1 Tax=Desulfovibrio legallii TaxID=571438 RepID=A0A1G7LSP7_9BACT|nr:glycosyltransferase [Desulfovibrio legallii]SDF52578.1 Glycosyl transferases group 1 [Desulfovibrio legallii]
MPRLLWIGSPFFCRSLRRCGWDAVAAHNFETPETFGWDALCRLAGFTPDVLVVADKSRPPFVLGVENFPCLTVFYSVDAHIHAWQPFYAQSFDACLVSLRDYLPRFAGPFLPAGRVWWSPAFAWQEDAPAPQAPKDWDCLFVGSQGPELPRRAAFLQALQARLPGLRITCGPYRGLYPRARVVLNHCEHGDLNFRVFEALGCGCCLATPRIGHGLADLFAEGVQLCCYEPDNVEDACRHISRLLEHPREAAAMGLAGLAAVDAAHRERHRAQAFTLRVRALLAAAPALQRRRRRRAALIRESSLRLLYLAQAEASAVPALRQAYLDAARGSV